jgi:hypothetical protein
MEFYQSYYLTAPPRDSNSDKLRQNLSCGVEAGQYTHDAQDYAFPVFFRANKMLAPTHLRHVSSRR